MRLRELLICTGLLSLGLVNVNATPPVFNAELEQPVKTTLPNAVATSMSVPLPPVPSPLIEEDRVLGEAYYNTLGILSGDNACSDFFGGAERSIAVFNTFMSRVKKDYLARSIGMRMSGSITTGVNLLTKTKFRLFDKVTINANGPFYRKKISPTDASVPRLGGFEPNTKEVRVLILLHELGHLMKGDDGSWLLPDDGKAEDLSRNNSHKIEDVCGEQIKDLRKGDSK